MSGSLIRAFFNRDGDEDGGARQVIVDLDEVAAAIWNDDFDILTIHLKGGQTMHVPMDAGNSITEALAGRAELWEI